MVQVFVRTPPGQLSVQINTNDSLECRNYHSSMAMDLSKQTARAADIHTRYLLSNKATCIDCHKGIAHELPDMQGIDPGWKVPAELMGKTAYHGGAEADRLLAYLAEISMR